MLVLNFNHICFIHRNQYLEFLANGFIKFIERFLANASKQFYKVHLIVFLFFFLFLHPPPVLCVPGKIASNHYIHHEDKRFDVVLETCLDLLYPPFRSKHKITKMRGVLARCLFYFELLNNAKVNQSKLVLRLVQVGIL